MPWPSQSGPLLCYVTNRRALPPPSRCTAATALGWAACLLDTIANAVQAGVDFVQLREKDLSGKTLLDLAVAANARAENKLLINDRLDVALAAGAAGVHLGGESVPVSEVARLRPPSANSVGAPLVVDPDEARAAPSGGVHPSGSVGALLAAPSAGVALGRELPRGFLVGRSCHSLDESLEAQRAGADYIFFGPVFATPSKLQFGPPQGLESLAAVCRQVRIPVLAIGGTTLQNAAGCVAAGAAGIAAIRLFQDSSDLAVAVRALKQQQ